tara:strand:+ start:2416 stop:3345 length:930 start_codon:yes stop_codon:yes gene_type:complete
MKFLKPKFWDNKKDILSILLKPISILFYFLINLRKYFIRAKKFKIPIICIGNIYVGGTGKTPVSLIITNELKIKKKKPVIIKKYYKDHGDEHRMIRNTLDSLILDKNRARAIKEAERKNFDVAILDDGFQDYAIEKDLNIVCFNSKQLIGNGSIFPAGPLRENLNSLKRAQIVIINGERNKIFERKILEISKGIKIFYSRYKPTNIEQFKNKKLYAFAGIGNPNNFFELLSEYNLNVQKKLSFPDHYNFTEDEIEKMTEMAGKNDLELITTEKDFYRIKDYNFKEIKYLKLDLMIKEKNKLISEIVSYL